MGLFERRDDKQYHDVVITTPSGGRSSPPIYHYRVAKKETPPIHIIRDGEESTSVGGAQLHKSKIDLLVGGHAMTAKRGSMGFGSFKVEGTPAGVELSWKDDTWNTSRYKLFNHNVHIATLLKSSSKYGPIHFEFLVEPERALLEQALVTGIAVREFKRREMGQSDLVSTSTQLADSVVSIAA